MAFLISAKGFSAGSTFVAWISEHRTTRAIAVNPPQEWKTASPRRTSKKQRTLEQEEDSLLEFHCLAIRFALRTNMERLFSALFRALLCSSLFAVALPSTFAANPERRCPRQNLHHGRGRKSGSSWTD
jgi:hypothetical protein